MLQPDDNADNVVVQPPLLCIEILSPSDRFSFTVEECKDYLEWGVPACWILNPETKQAWSISPAGLEEVPAKGTLEAGEISLPMSDVFPS